MRVKLYIILIILLWLNSFINLFAKVENKIILKVENEIITNFEVKNKILSTLILANQSITQENINKLKKNSLELLIQAKLKKIELSKYNYKTDTQKINSYIRSISTGNEDILKKEFKKNNLDFKLFLDEIDTEFKWQKLIYDIYAKRIKIDENNLNLEIKNLIKNKSNIEEFKISEIEVFIDEDTDIEKEILEIKNQIKDFGFEATAMKLSVSSSAQNKGNLGWINGTSLSEKTFKIISKLKIGEVATPIKNQNNLVFLKLDDKKISKSNDINIEELKKNIINNKKNELFNLYSQSHISKLKNTSFIEYK